MIPLMAGSLPTGKSRFEAIAESLVPSQRRTNHDRSARRTQKPAENRRRKEVDQVKPLKMFGLTLAAAVAAMALIGASSAVALESTALCKVSTSPCPEKSIYPSGTVVKAQLLHQTASLEENLSKVSPSLLLGPGLAEEVKCWESTASGKTTTGLVKEGPVGGTLESLSFGHCFHKTGVSCTVTVNQLGTLTLQKTGVNVGEAKVNGVLVTVVCGTVFKCVYTTQELPMAAKGTGPSGEVAELTANHAPLVLENPLTGIGCPTEGFFDAAYEIVEPATGFITS
jgi:hypothetical protein